MGSRIRSAFSLYAYAALGVFLVVSPWTPVWEQAAGTLVPDAVKPWVLSGWVRGIVSGLGLLDLAVALQFGAELWGRDGRPGPEV